VRGGRAGGKGQGAAAQLLLQLLLQAPHAHAHSPYLAVRVGQSLHGHVCARMRVCVCVCVRVHVRELVHRRVQAACLSSHPKLRLRGVSGKWEQLALTCWLLLGAGQCAEEDAPEPLVRG